MDFFMVCHYTYDGYAGHDQDNIIAFKTSDECLSYLNNRETLGDLYEYAWEDGEYGYKQLVFREGQYGYDKYFIEPMNFGEEF